MKDFFEDYLFVIKTLVIFILLFILAVSPIILFNILVFYFNNAWYFLGFLGLFFTLPLAFLIGDNIWGY